MNESLIEEYTTVLSEQQKELDATHKQLYNLAEAYDILSREKKRREEELRLTLERVGSEGIEWLYSPTHDDE